MRQFGMLRATRRPCEYEGWTVDLDQQVHEKNVYYCTELKLRIFQFNVGLCMHVLIATR